MLKISRAAFYRAKAAGKLPRSGKITGRLIRWLLSEVIAWLRAGMPDQAAWLEIRGTFGFGNQGAK